METTLEPPVAVESSTAANQSLADAIDPCQYRDYYDRFMTLFMIIPAILFIAALSFIVRRTQLRPGCCWGRPAVVQPLNMLDDFGRRWAFAACYIIITYNIIELFIGQYVWDPLRGADPLWLKKFGWLKVFVKLGNVLHVCLDYYPLFACVSHRHLIAANVLGFIYTIPYIVIEIIGLQLCPLDRESSKYTGTVMDLVFRLPGLVSLFLLMFVYAFDFVCNVRRSCAKSRKTNFDVKSAEVLELMESVDDSYLHCVLYVKELLRRKERKEEPPEPKTLVEKVKRKIGDLIERFTYRNSVGFKYPVRLICTMAVSIFAVLIIAILFGVSLDAEIVSWYNPLQDLVVLLFPANSTLRRVPEYVYGFRVVVALSNALATAIQLLFAAHILITCRLMLLKQFGEIQPKRLANICPGHRMHKLFRGSHKWYAKSTADPSSRLISGMRYSGYQIAFFIFGWIFVYFVIVVILIVVVIMFAIPIRYGERSFLIDKIIDLWPTILLGIIIAQGQNLLCKYFFLQDKGTLLALNNRRLYHVMSYFLFVLNVIVGVFAAAKRVVLSMVFGTLILSRLDHVLLMRGFEKFDSGHTAYLSMLIVDVYHNHPVLRSFVLLLEQVRTSRLRSSEASTSSDDNETGRQTPKPKLRYRNMWLKSLTLINNPTLVLERLQQQQQQRRKRGRDTLEDKLRMQENAEFMRATTGGSSGDDTRNPSPATELSLTERHVNGGGLHFENKGHTEQMV